MKNFFVVLLALGFLSISISSTLACDVKANSNFNDNDRSLEVQKSTIINVFSVSAHSKKTDKNVKFNLSKLMLDSGFEPIKTTLSSRRTHVGYKLFWILLPINVKK